MINSGTVRTRLGAKLDGTPVYSNLQKIVDGKLPVIDSELIGFNLPADSDVHQLATGEFPAGDLYVDGTTFESINGGLASATVASVGTASLNTLSVGGRVVNIVKVLDTNNDEVIVNTQEEGEVRDAKLVYGVVQTTGADGVAIDDTNIQLSFVVFDDVTNAFKAYVLPTGDYKVQFVKMYTVGTASEADKLSAYLTGKNVGGVALDEILALTQGGHGVAEFTFDAELEVADVTKVQVQFVDSTTSNIIVDGASVADVAKLQDGRKVFNDINFGGFASSEEVSVNLNGVTIPSVKTTIVDKDTVEFDLSLTVDSGFRFYIGDTVTVTW